MNENSLEIFSKASQMLAEADSIQKTKELKSMALTALEWAKQKKLGKEAEQHCYSYAMEAERKMGQMLVSTERSRGGQPYQKKEIPTGHNTVPVEPTLTELGITKNESSQAQTLAKLSDEKFEKVRKKEVSLSERED